MAAVYHDDIVTCISDYRRCSDWLIGLTDHSQVELQLSITLTNSHITNHSTLNLPIVLSLAFTIRFLAMDLSQSHRNFKYH
jgi:hypothetical protein